MKTPAKRRKPAKPAGNLPAEIHVKYFMGKSHVIADVKEPNGAVNQWVLPLSIVPESERPDVGTLKFLSGDHVLYQEQSMPKPVEVPFYKLLEFKKKGKARKAGK